MIDPSALPHQGNPTGTLQVALTRQIGCSFLAAIEGWLSCVLAERSLQKGDVFKGRQNVTPCDFLPPTSMLRISLTM